MLNLKRKNKGKNKVRVQANFYDQLSQAQLKAFEPYIKKQVLNAGEALYMEFGKLMNDYKLRIKVLENALVSKVRVDSQEDLDNLYFQEQDVDYNYTETSEAAVQDSFVRLAVTEVGKPESKRNLATMHLDTAPHQIHADVEKEVIGMVKGQLKIVTVKDDQGNDRTFEVKLLRVSKKNETTQQTQEAAQTETQEGANAAEVEPRS